jgi:hypothetical protein
MLSDITREYEDIGGRHDLFSTSIAVDPDRVKPLAALESPSSWGLSVVEPGDGPGAQLWLKSGERVARLAAGATGRDVAAALAGMVRSGPRQSGQEASHTGGGNLFCAMAAALVLAWWPEERQELALALDATTLGQRFTVLCVRVLVRGCAIAVAWKVLAYTQKGSWQP